MTAQLSSIALLFSKPVARVTAKPLAKPVAINKSKITRILLNINRPPMPCF